MNILPTDTSREILALRVLELVLYVTLPSNIRRIYVYRRRLPIPILIQLIQHIRIIEYALRYEPTGRGSSSRGQRTAVDTDVPPDFFVGLDWVAVTETVGIGVVLAFELLVVARFDVATVVLVEVVQLVVKVDWLFYFFSYLELNRAVGLHHAPIIIPLRYLYYIVTHNIEDNSQGQEYYSEY